MNHFWTPFLLLALSLPSLCQTVPSDRPEPAKLISEVREHYANAKTYRIEAIQENNVTGKLSKQWDKSIFVATVSIGNRYRFEAHTRSGEIVKISDGKTEWVYDPVLQMYTEAKAPNPGPGEFEGAIQGNQLGLLSAQDLANELSKEPANLLDPVYKDDETLSLEGKLFLCFVVYGRGRFHGGWSQNTTSEMTYWIDKQSHVIRKSHGHLEGDLISNEPGQYYVKDEVTVYPVVELNPTSLSDSIFTFQYSLQAKRVAEFPNPTHPHTAQLIGKAAPELMLHSTTHNSISLSEYRGKPVLLEFWATWCPPCVAAMPALHRIHSDASGKGLVMLSIDEDEDEKTATDFWTKHRAPWLNFHDGDGEAERQFNIGGVPKLILVDASGKIVYAQVGFSESQVRAAIAKLGPEYAELNKMQQAESSPKK